MGCGCLTALAALVSPRLALVLVWLFSDWLTVSIESGWLGLVGFLLLPWTTLVWAVTYVALDGVSGLGWFVVALAFLGDLGAYGGANSRR